MVDCSQLTYLSPDLSFSCRLQTGQTNDIEGKGIGGCFVLLGSKSLEKKGVLGSLAKCVFNRCSGTPCDNAPDPLTGDEMSTGTPRLGLSGT